MVNQSSIPDDLKQLPQWVVHRKKIPHNPKTGKRASVMDPSTWGSFDKACAAMSSGGYDGLGFVFTTNDPFVGIDFDHCIENGKLNQWVENQVSALNGYTEISPSGTGIHVICRGSLPGESVKTDQAEMYEKGRYFTVTGNPYGTQAPITSADQAIRSLYEELTLKRTVPDKAKAPPQPAAKLKDDQLIEKALAAKNGKAFRALMDGDVSAYGGDHSRADMALCNILAFWSDDIDQMDRIFRNSGLMRDKWDRRQSGSTYGRLQLEKAIQEAHKRYDPEHYRLEQAQQDFSNPAPKQAGLSIITARDLAVKHLEPVRFFVEDLLPQGLALLSAPPKYGKSWFVLDLCLSIAQGKPFLGRTTHPCTCLYLALEDSENRLKSRMLKLLSGGQAPENFLFSISAPDLANGLIEQLETTLAAYPDTGLIVIDTFQKIRGPSSRNEGVYKYDYREMSQIKAFADRHAILVLLVHHLRKMADDTDPHNRISGTNGIMGAADTSLVLTRQKRSDPETTLSITGRDIDGEDMVLRFDTGSCKWGVAGTPEDMRREDARRKYLEKPLVQVIRSLVFQGGGKWRGKMKMLNEASAKILGDQLLEDNELRKYPGMLKAIKDDLDFYDGITYTRMKNGVNGGGGEYVFSSRVQEEPHTERELPTAGINGGYGG